MSVIHSNAECCQNVVPSTVMIALRCWKNIRITEQLGTIAIWHVNAILTERHREHFGRPFGWFSEYSWTLSKMTFLQCHFHLQNFVLWGLAGMVHAMQIHCICVITPGFYDPYIGNWRNYCTFCVERLTGQKRCYQCIYLSGKNVKRMENNTWKEWLISVA